jgi:hypothetical protein
MNRTDMIMLFLFVVVFVLVPAILIQLGSRRSHASRANLQECPACGAENYKGKQRCYCCGYELIYVRSTESSEPLLQRVKRADADRMGARIAAQSPQTVEH